MIASLVLFLTIAVIPATTRDVRVHLMDSHSALVKWSTREQSQGHVTSYYIEYKVKDYDEVQLKVVQNQNRTSLTGLQSHAVYEVRVRAVNGAGGGMWSHYETLSTGETCKKKMKPFYFWVRLQTISWSNYRSFAPEESLRAQTYFWLSLSLSQAHLKRKTPNILQFLLNEILVLSITNCFFFLLWN